MKVLVASAVLFVASMVVSVGQAASPIAGNWKFTGVTCGSGAAPEITPGMSYDSVVISETEMTIFASYQGCQVVVGPIAVSISSDKITPVGYKGSITTSCPNEPQQINSPESVKEVGYSLTGDVLTIISKNEHYKGVCALGDTEISTHQRIP